MDGSIVLLLVLVGCCLRKKVPDLGSCLVRFWGQENSNLPIGYEGMVLNGEYHIEFGWFLVIFLVKVLATF